MCWVSFKLDFFRTFEFECLRPRRTCDQTLFQVQSQKTSNVMRYYLNIVFTVVTLQFYSHANMNNYQIYFLTVNLLGSKLNLEQMGLSLFELNLN